MVDEEGQKKKQSVNEGKITFTVQGNKENIIKKEEVKKKDEFEGEKMNDDKKGVKDKKITNLDNKENIKNVEGDSDNEVNNRIIRIELNNVSKRFDRSYQKNQTALARLLNFFRGESRKDFWAIENISLSIRAGENLGVIGKNGSGKSTLLRAIAEVYKVEEGDVWTNGQLVYLTGFGHGLQPRLTMKENIFLVGSVMGLGQPDIKERFDEIVEFAGLKDYADTKLFKFSSGMQTRLASSIGLHCVAHRKPDILLVDEVIGGGADKEYQEKSLKKMEELLKGGSTVVLVSHNLDAIKKYCDRVIWLDDGKVRMEGGAEEVVKGYEKENEKMYNSLRNA